MGEMFNAFNIVNLTGYSFGVDAYNAAACGPLASGASTRTCAPQTYAFGKPTQRAARRSCRTGRERFRSARGSRSEGESLHSAKL